MKPSLRLQLLLAKARFLATPVHKRVRLHMETDGRHLTFLLVSLHAQGYAVHVVASPMIFRELLALKKSAPIPFIIGGKARRCGLAICDTTAALNRGNEPRNLLLDYDFFSPEKMTPRMPYFMHPGIYHSGLHRLPVPDANSMRPVSIGFFGSRDADFYTRHFHFPLLNREQILAAFLDEFEDLIWMVDVPVQHWGKREFAVAIDNKGGDHNTKAFLSQPDYLAALRQCDFFLSPPGWCMPLSHNLIEGMAAGCIPIINCQDFMHPALEDGVNCLAFHDHSGLLQAIHRALALAPPEVCRMRRAVLHYHKQHLEPRSWLSPALTRTSGLLLVNAEELSVPL